ncbi:hypothetical protein ACFL3D_04965 [Candidatus Omnitrophota bacterium]
MQRNVRIITYFIVAGIVLAGCGETVRGMWKDMQRVGGGLKKVFICDSAVYGE